MGDRSLRKLESNHQKIFPWDFMLIGGRVLVFSFKGFQICGLDACCKLYDTNIRIE